MTDPTPLTDDQRAAAVVSAFADADITSFATSNGVVTINDASIGDQPNAVVLAIGGGLYDPDVVIVNPPVYVPDPSGDTEVNGVMYRYDPLAAVAEAVGMHGGSA